MLFNLRPKKQRESGEGSYIYMYIYIYTHDFFLKLHPKCYLKDPWQSHYWKRRIVMELTHDHPIDMNEQAQL
jgi:hypothetical protein